MSKISRFSLAFSVCLASLLWLFGLQGVESLATAKAEKSRSAVEAPLTASAPCGQASVFNAGIADNFDFDLAIDTELTQPSPALAQYLETHSIERREFDDISHISSHRAFAHTFVSLTHRFLEQPICAASLKIHLKAGLQGTTDDTLGLGFIDHGEILEWERYLGSGNLSPGLLNYDWTAGVNAAITLNLDQLPLAGGGTTSILPALNQYGFLDVLVADNTGVDYISLTVWYEKEDTRGHLIEIGGSIAAAGQIVGLGPSGELSTTINLPLTIGECVSASLLQGNQQLCLYHITSTHSVSDVLASIPSSPIYTFEPNYIIHANGDQDVFGSPGEPPGITITAGTSLYSQWFIDAIGGLPAGLPTGDGIEVAIFDTSCFSVGRNKYQPMPFIETSIKVLHPFTTTYASLPYTSTIHANICGHGEYAASLIHTVAPSATLSLYRILDDTGRGDLFTLNKMLNTFISDSLATGTLNQTVINLSLGVAAPLTRTAPITTTIIAESLQTILQAAHNQGAVIVAAAGNDSKSDVISPTQQPAANDFVIGVAASDPVGDRAFYSNAGQVAAPGGFGHCDDVVTSTDCLVGVDQTSITGYRAWAGTSFAAPLVSGLAALLREQTPSSSPNEVANRIYAGSTPSPLEPDLGAGIINVPCTVGHPSCNAITLQSGWNHISLPVDPITTPLKASDLCEDINAQGGNAVEIDRWHNGGWDGHICGIPFNNFDLVLGASYFIKSTTSSTWEFRGDEVIEPVPLTLQFGWNSLGIPHTDAYSAESLCNEIISQGVNAVEIDRWHNGGWDGYICGLPFNDFNIESGRGYFVKTTSSGTVTP